MNELHWVLIGLLAMAFSGWAVSELGRRSWKTAANQWRKAADAWKSTALRSRMPSRHGTVSLKQKAEGNHD